MIDDHRNDPDLRRELPGDVIRTTAERLERMRLHTTLAATLAMISLVPAFLGESHDAWKFLTMSILVTMIGFSTACRKVCAGMIRNFEKNPVPFHNAFTSLLCDKNGEECTQQKIRALYGEIRHELQRHLDRGDDEEKE